MGGINDIRYVILPVQPVSEMQKTGKQQDGNVNNLNFEFLLREAQNSLNRLNESVEEKEEIKPEVDNNVVCQQLSLQNSLFMMERLINKSIKKDEKK